MILNVFYMSISVIQSVLIVVMLGILVSRFFSKEMKSKFDTILLAIILVSWCGFSSFGFYGVFFDELPEIFNWVSFSSLILAIIGFVILIVRHFKIVNKPLVALESLFFVAIVVMVSFDKYNYGQELVELILLFTFFVVGVGYFIVIDYFIRDAGGYLGINKDQREFGKILIGGLFVLLFVLLVVPFFSYGFFDKDISEELVIYGWEDYIPEDVLDAFENEYGINVIFRPYVDEFEMFRNLERQAESYDLLIMEDEGIKRAINKDLLSPIDKKLVKNIKNLDDNFLNKDYDLDNRYSVPYLWGTTGFVFNIKYLPKDTNSWDVFWNIDYQDKVSMLDNPRAVIGVGAKFIGNPLVPTTELELKEVEDFLYLQKDVLRGYENYFKIVVGVISEELWAAQVHTGIIGFIIEKNPEIRYVIPKEGAEIWIDSFAISKYAENKIGANLFIDYILRAEISARCSDWTGSPTPNKMAWKFIDEDVLSNPMIYPSQEVFDKLEFSSSFDQSEEIIEMQKHLWEKLVK